MTDLTNPTPFVLQITGHELTGERWNPTFPMAGQEGAQEKKTVKKTDRPSAKAVVGIIHGFGEHQGRYAHVAKAFAARGLVTYTLDLPGHGKSKGRRGHVKSIKTYLEAIACLSAKAKKECPQLPFALFGHSLGGGLVARYLTKNQSAPVDVAILSSPWIKLALKPPALKLLMGRIALKLGLGLSQSSNLDPTLLSRDPKVQKDFTEDLLVHNSITPQTFFGVLDSGDHLLHTDHKTTIPVLFTHGSDDKITSMEATQKLSKIWGMHATFKAWEGMRHEPHNDLEREQVLFFYMEWLLQNLKVES